LLIGLKSDFLRQHDIACGEITYRYETPCANGLTDIIELLDIRLVAVMDSIDRPAIATGYFKKSMSLV